MTIITEDGTGLPAANSYQSVVGATAYHSLRLNDDWSDATPSEQAGALVRATDYLETTYRAIGDRAHAVQALQWPVEGQSVVPAAVVASTTLLALYGLSGPLVAPITSRGIIEQEQKLDGVGLTLTKYDGSDATDPYPFVTDMLAGVATRKGGASLDNTAYVRRLIV